MRTLSHVFFSLDPSPVRRVPIQTGIQRKLNFVSVRTIKGRSSAGENLMYFELKFLTGLLVNNVRHLYDCFRRTEWERFIFTFLHVKIKRFSLKQGEIDSFRTIPSISFPPTTNMID